MSQEIQNFLTGNSKLTGVPFSEVDPRVLATIQRHAIDGQGYRRRREFYEWAFAAYLWRAKVSRPDRLYRRIEAA